MSTTITIRIPAELKQRMRKFPERWSETVRRLIEERVRQLELLRLIEETESRAGKRVLKVDSTRLIREDRER
jgi:predicted transcriptional regulator